MNRSIMTAMTLLALFLASPGCRRATPEAEPDAAAESDRETGQHGADDSPGEKGEEEPGGEAASAGALPSGDATGAAEIEISAEELLSRRLPIEAARDGWIRLFDGHTLFGWENPGDANWRVVDGTITVDSGQPGLLCTTVGWSDYELTLEFRAEPDTNSGVFLRTPLQPSDPASDCYEVNIAADDNPFPTASVVGRVKADPDQIPEQTFGEWRRMTMRVEGEKLSVEIDGVAACEVLDEGGLTDGRIGLQRNAGRVAFRDVRLRPLGLEPLLDDDLSRWTRYPDMPGRFESADSGGLHVIGGKGQLESRDRFGDFDLLAEYRMNDPQSNSGIFFRCIPGDEMMGYECQVNDETIDGNPLRPADGGTGGIFRRQNARVVAGRSGEANAIVIATRGPRIATWVNGIQVTDVTDERETDENPRRGLRVEAGTIIIQGHDPNTDVVYPRLMIAESPRRDR